MTSRAVASVFEDFGATGSELCDWIGSLDLTDDPSFFESGSVPLFV